MRTSIATLRDWFFSRGDASAAAAMRIAFAGCCLFMLWDLYPVRDLLLGHSGYYGTLDERYVERGALSLLFHVDSPLGTRITFAVGTLTAILVLVGLFTRLAVAASMIGLLLLHQRNPFMLFGADMVLFHIGLWLMFLRCDRAWSADQWLRERFGRAASREIELWPLRVIQIQVALIYFRTALTKSATEQWQDGSAVYYALLTLGNDLFPNVLEYKLLLTLLTYGTLFIEFAFPVLVFWGPTRWFAIVSVALMHLSIDLMMAIRFFGLVMYGALLAFVLPDEWLKLETRVRGWLDRGMVALSDFQRRDGERTVATAGDVDAVTRLARARPTAAALDHDAP